ncbi:hypothetical protein TeGR_g14739, partial [Tetraparma gracilis]
KGAGGGGRRGGRGGAAPGNPYGAPAPVQRQFVPTSTFGASKTRPAAAEASLAASALLGLVTFKPQRPLPAARVNAQQQPTGRPRAAPAPPLAPTVAEAAFFERARRHLERADLRAPPAAGERKHTPWAEFLKVLHMYAAHLLPRDALLSLLSLLFVHGHNPKGPNPGVSHTQLCTDAEALLREFDAMMSRRGAFATQERTLQERSKYGSASMKRALEMAGRHDREVEGALAERRRAEEAAAAAPPAPAADAMDTAPDGAPPAPPAPALSKPLSGVTPVGPSYSTLPSDYPRDIFLKYTERGPAEAKVLNDDLVSFAKVAVGVGGSKDRGNCHEEQEDDGQPLGRMQYFLKEKTFTSVHLNAISRIYGEAGDIVLEHLKTNAMAVLPVVMPRLKQKDAEWRAARKNLNARFKTIGERCHGGSLDFVSAKLKKAIATKHEELPLLAPWVQEGAAPVTAKIDKEVAADIYKLIASCTDSDAFDTDLDCSRIWCEFMLPFFDYEPTTLIAESHSEYLPPVYPTGTVVHTTYGVGKISYYSNDRQYYKVDLPYGTGWINPNSVFFPVLTGPQEKPPTPPDVTKISARQNHRLKTIVLPSTTFKRDLSESDDRGMPINKQTAYVTQSMFVALRLFASLCESLKKIKDEHGPAPSPASSPAPAKGGKKSAKKGKAKGKAVKAAAPAPEPTPMEVEPAASSDAAAAPAEGEAKVEAAEDAEMKKIQSFLANPN